MKATETRARVQAFSLLEMLLVVAMVGLLLGFSVPGWQQYQRVAGRQQGWQTLQEIGLSQSLWYSRYQNYFAEFGQAGLEIPVDDRYHYTIQLHSHGYQLIARVRQHGSQSLDLACYQLQLDQVGRRQAYNESGQQATGCF